MKSLVYLDHNATTPIRPEVIGLMSRVMSETGNASSIHSFGRTARKHVEDARGQIARAFDVGPQQIIFNSGATEGNNTILKGFSGRRVLVSAIEHASVIESGVEADIIPVTHDGVIDLDALKNLLAQGPTPALVSTMLVNNETGVIQPVADIAQLAKDAGACVHVDAVQAVGRIAFTRAQLNADFVTISAHKFGGPQGVGAIIMAPKAPLPKLLHGGGQERRQRAGTENVAGIAGLGLAVEQATADIPRFQTLAARRDDLENFLLDSGRGIRIYGRAAPRVANTISLSLTGSTSETLLMAFDLEGIALSSGSACSSGTVKPSHVLMAMGVGEEEAKCSLRVSLGWSTTVQDLDDFKAAWDKVRVRILK
jgi:cysteine desulfurase